MADPWDSGWFWAARPKLSSLTSCRVELRKVLLQVPSALSLKIFKVLMEDGDLSNLPTMEIWCSFIAVVHFCSIFWSSEKFPLWPHVPLQSGSKHWHNQEAWEQGGRCGVLVGLRRHPCGKLVFTGWPQAGLNENGISEWLSWTSTFHLLLDAGRSTGGQRVWLTSPNQLAPGRPEPEWDLGAAELDLHLPPSLGLFQYDLHEGLCPWSHLTHCKNYIFQAPWGASSLVV